MTFIAAEHPNEIAVVALNGFFPWLINVATGRTGYCHSFAIVDGHLIEAEPSGVIISPIDKYDGLDVIVSRFDLDADHAEEFSDFLHNQLGLRYSFIGDFIVGLDDTTPAFLDPIFHLIEHFEDSDKTWYCSALSDAAMTAAGETVIDGRALDKSVTPNDLAREFIKRGWDK